MEAFQLQKKKKQYVPGPSMCSELAANDYSRQDSVSHLGTERSEVWQENRATVFLVNRSLMLMVLKQMQNKRKQNIPSPVDTKEQPRSPGGP